MSFGSVAKKFRRLHSASKSSSASDSSSKASAGSASSSAPRLGVLTPPQVRPKDGTSSAGDSSRAEMPSSTTQEAVAASGKAQAETVLTTSTNAMDGALAELAPFDPQLTAGLSISKSETALNTMDNKIDELVSKSNNAMAVLNAIAPVVSAAGKTDLAQKIERGIQRFADDIPWLMKGLDELARIHPAVTVVVLAFKAVYALETTRQENDRRVMLLYVEMKDVMSVMVQLRGVESRTHIGLDGRVLQDRLTELAEKTAKDIKDCANVCDTFLKKRLIVKVLKGPVWAEKLAEFVKTFADRKADFQFALVMHTANTVTDIKKQNQEIDAKIDVVVTLFGRYLTKEEKRLADEIESKGGATKVRQSDDSLRSLIAISHEYDNFVSSSDQRVGSKQGRNDGPITLEDLKLELREDIADALARNFETFLGKFEIQVSMLQVALERYIREENDRIIGAVQHAVAQGPYLKIRDPELRRVWQDMNWRGNVKARLFVMTVRDYYRDAIEEAQHATAAEEQNLINDEWTLEYLGPTWLQPMFEAFDDDASGYVTIAEINKFMDLRPAELGWSLPRWLAYWAVGWGVGAAVYVRRIRDVLGGIRATLQHVLPLNRSAADDYLKSMWAPTLKLVLGVTTDAAWMLQARFQDYFDYEEQRIRSNLERIKYNIDAGETVSLVLGPGRPEKSILPLVLLLLEKDLHKFRAARQILLAESELKTSRTNMDEVFSFLQQRYTGLCKLFRDQKLDIDAQFERYACGLFRYEHAEDPFWHPRHLKDGSFLVDSFYDDSATDVSDLEEGEDIISPNDVYNTFDDPIVDDLQESAPPLIQRLLGIWHGFVFYGWELPTRPMLSITFHYSPGHEESLSSSGTDYNGDTYCLSGTCGVDEEGWTTVQWTMRYSGDLTLYYRGRLLDDHTIKGDRGDKKGQYNNEALILKKIPAAHMCLRPLELALGPENKPRLLWNYAIAAVLHDIRRYNWSWSYFSGRRDTRRRFIELMSRQYRRPPEDLDEQVCRVRRDCTSQDARFYCMLAERTDRIVPCHGMRSCDGRGCDNLIGGACLICLDCVTSPNHFYTHLTFCDDPACYNSRSTYSLAGEPRHEANHDFLKIRTVLHAPDIPAVLRDVENAFNLMRWFTSTVPPDPPVGALADTRLEVEPCSDGVCAGGASVSGPGEDAPQSGATGTSIVLSNAHKESVDPANFQSTTGSFGDMIEQEPIAAQSTDSKADLALDEVVEASPLPGLDVSVSPRRRPRDVDTVISEGGDVQHVDPAVCRCKVCKEPVYMGLCWFCLRCWVVDYVCNDCDARMLIACHECEKPFAQPDWYCGQHPSDFLCPRCFARGITEPTNPEAIPRRSHIGTHSLIRCKHERTKPTNAESEAAVLTTEERLANLEWQMTAVDEKLEKMQDHLLRLDRRQDEMQQAILSRLQEMLARVTGDTMDEIAERQL
ncbi:hypothetical protein PYCCODRAFT_1405323 [Trametes coccinea BRFM310]|uniref:EF-hand domain-containing protein n=1 Tax=Trametes coccinea (strain BRFM310) TaxID=1353009 RepID=A0A1Y2IYE3_TRAC3|nr:hypothetical protein PYCCODRAFT_1405323 [Trametes coccinea BRFM310]